MKNRNLKLLSVAMLSFLGATVVNALPAPVPCTNCYQPALATSWNYVISENPDLSIKVGLYDVDMFNTSAAIVSSIHGMGSHAVCYIDAGTWENWRPDASEFPASVKGKNNGWPGEKWLDIRQTSILGPIMQARVAQCKSKGFDAIEFDNVDGYSNKTGFPLKAADQLNYDTFIANMAHTAGLSVALKNDVDQATQLLPYFDFTINEQCFQYDECNTITGFIKASKAVFNVEYELSLNKFCPQAKTLGFNSIKKGINLDNPVQFCP